MGATAAFQSSVQSVKPLFLKPLESLHTFPLARTAPSLSQKSLSSFQQIIWKFSLFFFFFLILWHSSERKACYQLANQGYCTLLSVSYLIQGSEKYGMNNRHCWRWMLQGGSWDICLKFIRSKEEMQHQNMMSKISRWEAYQLWSTISPDPIGFPPANV